MIVQKIILITMIAALLLTSSSQMTSAFMIQDGIVSGVIWDDENNNNIQELSEIGIKNVKIYVQNRATDETFTTETAEDGGFYFLDLLSGKYHLWYEYEGTVSETSDLELDELNGIASVNIPMSISADTPLLPAGVDQHHIIYLPIILR